MTHAELFRKLRLERELSQQNLAEGICSRSALASFEYRNTGISLEIAVKLLEKMNVTLDEYMFMYNQSSVSPKREVAFALTSSPNLTDVKTRLEKLFKETGDVYYEYLLIPIELSASGELSNKEKKQKINKIKNHLERVEIWGRFEISIFVNCLYFFESEFIKISLKSSIEKMKDFQDQTYTTSYLDILIKNGISLAIQREDSDLLNTFVRLLHSFEFKSKDGSFTLLKKFFETVDDTQLKMESKKDKLVEILSVFSFMELCTWEKFLKQYLNRTYPEIFTKEQDK